MFGAVVAAYGHPKIKSGLDIGTGTGLLALMIAQVYTGAAITAVESDKLAYGIAKHNFENSLWTSRIESYNTTIQNFADQHLGSFDLILTNPPFYKNSLLGENPSKAKAMHQTTLSLNDLAKSVSKLLDPNGEFWLLLPAYEMQKASEKLAEFNLHINSEFRIHAHPGKKDIRRVAQFSYKQNQHPNREITIRVADNSFNYEYRQLLTPFYSIF